MTRWQKFWTGVGYPFKVLASVITAMINLTSRQIKSLFSVSMLLGIVMLSFQNMGLTFVAARAVEKGDTYRSFFDLIQEQMRINSGLIAWFAIIMGLIVFGADYFRAKLGNKELEFGQGPKEPAPFRSLDEKPSTTPAGKPDTPAPDMSNEGEEQGAT